MLFGLLATFFIVSSMGVVSNTAPVLDKSKETPTIQKAPQPKKENNNDLLEFSITAPSMSYTTVQRNGTETLTDYQNNSGTVYSNRDIAKCTGYTYNNAMGINYEYYTQGTTFDYQEVEEEGLNTQLNTNRYVTYANQTNKFINNALLCLKIQPYQAFTETETGTEILTYFEIDRLSNTNIILEFQYLTSVDTNFSNYWQSESNTWQYYDFIKTKWNALTSPMNGFNYTSWATQHEINEFTTDTIDTNERIHIVGGVTNYIFILVSLIDQQPNFYTSDQGNEQYIQPIAISNVTFNGYYIPPVENYEVLDIPGLFYTIISLPFSFISTAFNITLWPGTPYQLNLSALIMAIIGCLIIIFILKILAKMYGKG